MACGAGIARETEGEVKMKRISGIPGAGGTVAAGISSYRRQEHRHAFVFLAPWIIGFLAFIAYPLIASIYYSLTDWDLLSPPKWYGLKNFAKMFTKDLLFWKSLRVTFVYALMRIPAGLIVGVGMALVMNSTLLKFKSFFRVMYYAPAVLPSVAISLMWSWLYAPKDGIFNNILGLFGIKGLLWLQSPTLVLPSFLIMAIWALMGKNMLIYLAGLTSIPEQLVESAAIDGAGGWRTFWRITLPLLTPVIFYELVMTMIESFKLFTQAYVMTQGGPRNESLFYVYYLYQNAFRYYQMGYASALAWMLFVIVLALTLIVFKFSDRWVYYEAG